MKTVRVVTIVLFATLLWSIAKNPFASKHPSACVYANSMTVLPPSQKGILYYVNRPTNPYNAPVQECLLNSVGIRAHIQSGGMTPSGLRKSPEEAATAMWQTYAALESVVQQIFPGLN